MDKKEFDSVAYLLYESDMIRYEKIIRRQWILCIVLGVATIVSTVIAFL